MVKIIKLASDITERVEKSISTREAAQKACAIASETVASAARGREVIDRVLDTSSHINTSVNAVSKQIEQLKDKYLRTVAEFDNYKKRTLKEKTELVLNGSEKAVCAVLPILDDFERALANNTDDAQAVKDGMQLIFNKFRKTLESLGVKKIETEGKDFDVDFHEAVAMVPGMGDDKKGKVIDCLQTGYQLNEKVIRHAKVAVGQ